ncbi:T9SS type A sorting domain-containing protein [Flavobacterium alkalisoli]|uniref:T9SS type A sorting domain-containing protein n=1 Tax=Flavobacterium alkalisoli TaxID=2602769 RepID=UPI003A8CA4A2
MNKKLLLVFLFFLQYGFSQESGWTLIQAGEDIYNGQIDGPDWPNRWDIESLDLKQVPGGFLTCGFFNDQTFDSTDGNVLDLTGHYGSYLVKYNYEGEILWMARTEKDEDEERNVIMSIATDSQNNIYIIGSSDGYFYDASGASQQVAPQYPEGGSSPFLMKLDEDGNFVWKTIITGCDAKRVAVDNNDNVVVCGTFNTGGPAYMFFNNQYVGILSNISESSDANYYIAKYASNGMPLWDAGVYIDAVNSEYLEGITFDQDNNIYVYGMYEMELKVYDTDGENYIQRSWTGNYGGSMFMVKYSPAGEAQWVVNSDDVIVSKVITTPDGNHYVAGTNGVLSTGQGQNGVHNMFNADGTLFSQSDYGPFYLAKIDAEGNWVWLVGSVGSTYGYATEMIMYDDKISIVGSLSSSDSDIVSLPVSLHGVDENDWVDFTIDFSDNFIVTYTLDGEIYSLSKSGDNGDNNYAQSTSGFFRDNEGWLYLQRNLWFGMYAEEQSFYGQLVAPIIGTTDASITKFKESDGEILYLSVDSFNSLNAILSPNPTNSEFSIALYDFYSQVELQVTDMSGKIILDEYYNNTDYVFTKINGAAGLYFVKVIADDNIQNFKVIKR